jgi:hypothetical protein
MSRFASSSGASKFSSSNSAASFNDATVVFNVGGKRFELSSSHLQKYPDSSLYRLATARHAHAGSPSTSSSSVNREIFLDHNYEAFSVIVDFIRYGGKVLIPRSVCTQVVLLQMKEFGLPVEKYEETEAWKPPSYDEAVMKSKGGAAMGGKQSDLAAKVNEIMERKVTTLIEDFIHPLIIRHADAGHIRIDIYIVEPKILPSEVASTIDFGYPVEWICLNQDQQLFKNDYSSSSISASSPSAVPLNDSAAESLKAMITTLDDLNDSQKQKLLKVIEKDADNRRRQSVELPNVEYLLQPVALKALESSVMYRSTVRKVTAELRDLTVRRENIYGLLESSSIKSVKVEITIA